MEVSLYKFLKAYNNDLKTSNNKYYGRAIGETYNVISKTFSKESIEPIDDYIRTVDTSGFRKISFDFLQTLKTIASSKYYDPLNQIQYLKTRINIGKELLNGRKKLDVVLQCGIDISKNNLMILAFSSNYNLDLEASMLKGLLIEFPTEDKLFIDVKRIDRLTCWELSKGEENVIDFSIVQPTSRNLLIKTANRLTCP
ncbi:hypothetical protein OW763_05985 [Clostridium aestuarii]|uniref:Uncharacterized protein n=1 Tax=Clostridium aestuarii TaxID=338193 RepID=A0ABT4CY45_9CLOT|nr:hypothetical protein [Clostridium aestuarii]MCY6483896.1 hypothetical protein [Clostridium aestuarii]